jgi:RsiW-degrading membrane proteinase PrsW (M82 family)
MEAIFTILMFIFFTCIQHDISISKTIKAIFTLLGITIAPLFAVLFLIDYSKTSSNFSFIVGSILCIIGYKSWRALLLFIKENKNA